MYNQHYDKSILDKDIFSKIPLLDNVGIIKKRRASGTDPTDILQPLEDIIMAPEVLDKVLERCSIPELLYDQQPGYAGVILYGPAGTGKTALQDALIEVYERAGAPTARSSFAEINSKWVGEYPKRLEEILKEAVRWAEEMNKPAFITFDESSSIIQKPDTGTSLSKHYQEGLEVLKKYIGNKRQLVICISTNSLPDTFEEPLIREGRLTSVFIGYPGINERARLWGLFLRKNNLITLSQKELEILASDTPEEQGAFIEEVCRNYRSVMRMKRMKENNGTLLEALKHGTYSSDEELKEVMSFAHLHTYVQEKIADKQRINLQHAQERIGFNPCSVRTSDR